MSYQRETNLQRKEKANRFKIGLIVGSGGSTLAPTPTRLTPQGSFIVSENKSPLTAIAALTTTVPEPEKQNRFTVPGLGSPLPLVTQSGEHNNNNDNDDNDNKRTNSDVSVKSTTETMEQKSSTPNTSTDSIAELISQATIMYELYTCHPSNPCSNRHINTLIDTNLLQEFILEKDSVIHPLPLPH